MGPLANNLSFPYPLPATSRLRLGSLPPSRRTKIPKLNSKILIPYFVNPKIIYHEPESHWSKINQSRNEVWLYRVGLRQFPK